VAVRVDGAGVGRAEKWWRRPLPGRLEAPVPSSYNDHFADAAVRDHVGDVWYQTLVRAPARWAGERVGLRFEAAMHRAASRSGTSPTSPPAPDHGIDPVEDTVVHVEELDLVLLAPGHRP
jgi:beta-glucuronidase